MENTTTEQKPWTPKVGDTCALKSGGPTMTITAITDSNAAGSTPATKTLDCVWFLQNSAGGWDDKIHRHAFQVESLKELNS